MIYRGVVGYFDMLVGFDSSGYFGQGEGYCLFCFVLFFHH